MGCPHPVERGAVARPRHRHREARRGPLRRIRAVGPRLGCSHVDTPLGSGRLSKTFDGKLETPLTDLQASNWENTA